MNKQTIIDALTKNYTSFIQYINSLTSEEYLYRFEQKWTAGQQLEHILLCVKPLVQVYGMDKLMIEQNFGKSDRAGRTQEGLLGLYAEKLKGGGKAPERFVPQAAEFSQRDGLNETLAKLIKDLCSKIENFTEEDLNTLLIPHPLLGNLTLREMLYNAIDHVEHHHESAKQNLKKQIGIH